MQIRQLTLPANHKKIIYQISRNGDTKIYTPLESSHNHQDQEKSSANNNNLSQQKKRQQQHSPSSLAKFTESLSQKIQKQKQSQKWVGCRMQLGLLNSIQLTNDNKLQNTFKDNPFQKPTKRNGSELNKSIRNKGISNVNGYGEDFNGTGNYCNHIHDIDNDARDLSNASQQFTCNCSKTKCIKLYCMCFANGLYCRPECTCRGCSNNQFNAQKLITLREQIIQRKPLQKLSKGCKCMKSNCSKKYCECFGNNQSCNEFCQCLDCHNKGTRRASSSSALSKQRQKSQFKKLKRNTITQQKTVKQQQLQKQKLLSVFPSTKKENKKVIKND